MAIQLLQLLLCLIMFTMANEMQPLITHNRKALILTVTATEHTVSSPSTWLYQTMHNPQPKMSLWLAFVGKTCAAQEMLTDEGGVTIEAEMQSVNVINHHGANHMPRLTFVVTSVFFPSPCQLCLS